MLTNWPNISMAIEFHEFEDATRLVTIRSVNEVETVDVESSLVRLLLRVTPEQRVLLNVVKLKARLRERGAIVVKDAVTTIRDRSAGPHRRQKRRDGVDELIQWLRGSGEDEDVVTRAIDVLGVVVGRSSRR